MNPDILLFGLMIVIVLISWALNVFVEKPATKLVSMVLTILMSISPKKLLKRKTQNSSHQV